MLVKWALERRKHAKTSLSPNGSDLPHLHGTAPPKDNPSATAKNYSDQQQISQLPVRSETTAQSPALTAELDRLHYQSNTALAKSSESYEDRTKRRIDADEMASSLRNGKLLSLSGESQIHSHNSYQGTGGPTHALTQENMQKFAHEQDPEAATRRECGEHEESSSLTLDPRSGTESNLHRPSLDYRESDRTVTPQMR